MGNTTIHGGNHTAEDQKCHDCDQLRCTVLSIAVLLYASISVLLCVGRSPPHRRSRSSEYPKSRSAVRGAASLHAFVAEEGCAEIRTDFRNTPCGRSHRVDRSLRAQRLAVDASANHSLPNDQQSGPSTNICSDMSCPCRLDTTTIMILHPMTNGTTSNRTPTPRRVRT